MAAKNPVFKGTMDDATYQMYSVVLSYYQNRMGADVKINSTYMLKKWVEADYIRITDNRTNDQRIGGIVAVVNTMAEKVDNHGVDITEVKEEIAEVKEDVKSVKDLVKEVRQFVLPKDYQSSER